MNISRVSLLGPRRAWTTMKAGATMRQKFKLEGLPALVFICLWLQPVWFVRPTVFGIMQKQELHRMSL